MSNLNQEDTQAHLLTYRVYARELLAEAHLQLVNAYHTCKEDSIVLWDPALRQLLRLPLVLFLLPCVVAILHHAATSRSRRQHALKVEQGEKDRRRAVLQKLLTILTPTCSRWPERYWVLAQEAVKSGVYKLSVGTLVDDIAKGEVELRDPARDFPCLIMGSLVVDGLQVQLECESTLCTRLNVVERNASNMDSLLRSRTSGPDAGDAVAYLDQILPKELATCIHSLQSSTPVGGSTLLGFTTRGPRFPSDKSYDLYMLAALPFLPRLYLISPAHTSSSSVPGQALPRTALRTQIPIHTTLDNIIAVLTSGSTPFTIKLIQNVSDDYATHLDAHAEHLATKSQVRTKFQQTWGMEGWREEQFVSVWEAALVRANILTRWVVRVDRRA